MRLNWLSWRWIVRKVATAHGLIDPIAVLSHMRRFAQPSEVTEPIELLRAGVVFHARGLMNSRAIQHNLDWIWPYWAVRQFDPTDPSFIPRAFSLTHINLTHRNWTGIGLPNSEMIPIVDPHGLLTPHFDGWSVDAWIIGDDTRLIPSRVKHVEQKLHFNPGPVVVTSVEDNGNSLNTASDVFSQDGQPCCHFKVQAQSRNTAWLAIALRPYNPEGVSFIHKIDWKDSQNQWQINGKQSVSLDKSPQRHAVSDYRQGDVYMKLPEATMETSIDCNVGMATAAVLYPLEADQPFEASLQIPLGISHREHSSVSVHHPDGDWNEVGRDKCRMSLPNEKYQYLFDSSLETLLLLSGEDVYPGPYTYKRFWFRDAAFILHGILCMGYTERTRRMLDTFPQRQKHTGFFHSQEGEWDSNGEALWIMKRYAELIGEDVTQPWGNSIKKAARWIERKRNSTHGETAHKGLYPAGFSAEHLGPIDYYYWDNFWGVEGLKAAAKMLNSNKNSSESEEFKQAADRFMKVIEDSLARDAQHRKRPAMPAAPGRRLDSGAVGSIVVGYPLALWPPDDPRLADTIEYLLKHCTIRGGFFQDMIHSGINAYLTLQIAQILLATGDLRFSALVDTVADLASPTGKWPEAIHAQTCGGCMGDGEHAWAAAEWVLMMRSLFVLEQPFADRLVIGAGLTDNLLQSGSTLFFGPTPTPWGTLSVKAEIQGNRVVLSWEVEWRKEPSEIEIRLPGQDVVRVEPSQREFTLERKKL